MKEIFNYEQAVKDISSIVERMESGSMSVDEMAKELKTAQNLLKKCRQKLKATDKEIKLLLEDDADAAK